MQRTAPQRCSRYSSVVPVVTLLRRPVFHQVATYSSVLARLIQTMDVGRIDSEIVR